MNGLNVSLSDWLSPLLKFLANFRVKNIKVGSWFSGNLLAQRSKAAGANNSKSSFTLNSSIFRFQVWLSFWLSGGEHGRELLDVRPTNQVSHGVLGTADQPFSDFSFQNACCIWHCSKIAEVFLGDFYQYLLLRLAARSIGFGFFNRAVACSCCSLKISLVKIRDTCTNQRLAARSDCGRLTGWNLVWSTTDFDL